MKASTYFGKFARQLPDVVERSIKRLAEIGQKEAANTDLFQEHSSNGLKHNIKIKEPGQFIREVLADRDYAYYVEFGNDQDGLFIEPRRKKVLRFMVGNQVIFAKYVLAHGPIPFMTKARNKVELQANHVVEFELQRLMRSLGNG